MVVAAREANALCVRRDGAGGVETCREDELQPSLPSVGCEVMIVRGGHRGEVGTLIEVSGGDVLVRLVEKGDQTRVRSGDVCEWTIRRENFGVPAGDEFGGFGAPGYATAVSRFAEASRLECFMERDKEEIPMRCTPALLDVLEQPELHHNNNSHPSTTNYYTTPPVRD